MKIGDLARRAGSTSETIRYYERIDLLPRPDRTGSNYRDYGERDVERLAFIRHARGLGFEIDHIRSLLDLAEQPDRDCAAADAIASRHLAAVQRKIEQLERLRGELDRMVRQCRGGQMSSCHIIETLSDHAHCGTGHSSPDV
jgi:Cu(I)-responsive transcriptional regulator